MKVLMEMGHGDELVLADANFPALSHAQRFVRSDCAIPELLDGILRFFPLDTFVPDAVFLMKVVKGDNYKPVIWDTYQQVIRRHEPKFSKPAGLDRFAFYDRAKSAFAIVATAETARYANVILKKGIVETP
jgi:L-fucose mutarotase